MQRGFSLLETLIALLLFTLILKTSNELLFHVNKITVNDYFIQDLLSSYQLQHIFMLSQNVALVDETFIEFIYFDEYHYLEILKDKIIMGEGTVIYFNQIDDAYFELVKKELYLNYQRDAKEYQLKIGKINE